MDFEVLKEKISDSKQLLISGYPNDEAAFKNFLYDLVHRDDFTLWEGKLDKLLEPKFYQNLLKIFELVKSQQNLSVNRLVAFIQGFQLIPSIPNKDTISELVSWLMSETEGQLDSKAIERPFTDCVKWSNKYLSFGKDNPKKVLWYRNHALTEGEQWFIDLIAVFDIQLVIVDVSKTIQPLTKFKKVFDAGQSCEYISFPQERVAIVSTVAREASEELNTIMNHGEAGIFFKPFQFRNAKVSVVRLKTTYDEIKIMGETKAYLRPGFASKDAPETSVEVPVMFSKVNGRLDDLKDYVTQYESLKKDRHFIEYTQYPIIKINPQAESAAFAKYRELFPIENLDAQLLVESDFWKYQRCSTGLQNSIAKAIINYLKKPLIKLKTKEQLPIFQANCLEVLFNLPTNFINLIQKTDASQEVPKLLLKDLAFGGVFSRNDALYISFASQLGVDVLLYNLSGTNDIENYMDENLLDIHWLNVLEDERNIESTPQRHGFLSSLFG